MPAFTHQYSQPRRAAGVAVCFGQAVALAWAPAAVWPVVAGVAVRVGRAALGRAKFVPDAPEPVQPVSPAPATRNPAHAPTVRVFMRIPLPRMELARPGG